MSRKLTRHVKTRHKDVQRVKDALVMKKERRIIEFQKIRREGIRLYNEREASKKHPVFQGERKQRKYKKLTQCSACLAFLSRRFFSLHKKSCRIINDCLVIPLPVTQEVIPGSRKLSKDFILKVLSTLRNDELGTICRKDEFILYIGSKLFSARSYKTEKMATVLKSVRTEMRTLAHLYRAFVSLEGVTKTYENIVDMFLRENFDYLCDSVDIITIREDKSTKSGLRQNLCYTLLSTVEKLRDLFFQEKRDELSEELNKMLRCLKSNVDIIVSSARYLLEKTRLLKTRKPCKLPLEEDIKLLHTYILKRLKLLTDDYAFPSSHTFVELRNLALTRLTLLNARRGGEAGRLQTDEWLEAEQGGWIDKQRLANLSPADKMLVKAMKIAYQTGKGNKHIVSLLVPQDTAPALKKLSDSSFPKKACVNESNTFVFASTQLSDLNALGWHVLKDVCGEIKLQNTSLINATNNRHRVSTLYASLNLPKHERKLFYTHMGQSDDINKDTYQATLPIMSITKVGKQLMQIDVAECL